jgi:predicted TIM-barrel fold metal-dependent hydrolase
MELKNEILAGKPLSCRVIDSHTHICSYTASAWYQYQPELENVIKDMDRYGIDAIVTAPHPLVGSYCELGNSITAEAIIKYPGRIFGYIIFNPVYGIEEARKLTKKYAKTEGFIGFKFLSGYHGSLLSEPYQYGFKAADELHAPVLCHTWGGNPPISEFRKIAEKFPDLSLLIAHGGGSRKTYQECIELLNYLPNVFIEICGGIACDWWLEDIVREAGADRIIYGSDTINLDTRYDLGRVVFADIAESDKEKILSGNYEKIIRRSKMPKKKWTERFG